MERHVVLMLDQTKASDKVQQFFYDAGRFIPTVLHIKKEEICNRLRTPVIHGMEDSKIKRTIHGYKEKPLKKLLIWLNYDKPL